MVLGSLVKTGLKTGTTTIVKTGLKTGLKTSAKTAAKTSAKTAAKTAVKTGAKTGLKTGVKVAVGAAAVGLYSLGNQKAEEAIAACTDECLPSNYDELLDGNIQKSELSYSTVEGTEDQPVCTEEIENCGNYCSDTCEGIHDMSLFEKVLDPLGDAPGPLGDIGDAAGDLAGGAVDLAGEVVEEGVDLAGDIAEDVAKELPNPFEGLLGNLKYVGYALLALLIIWLISKFR